MFNHFLGTLGCSLGDLCSTIVNVKVAVLNQSNHEQISVIKCLKRPTNMVVRCFHTGKENYGGVCDEEVCS